MFSFEKLKTGKKVKNESVRVPIRQVVFVTNSPRDNVWGETALHLNAVCSFTYPNIIFLSIEIINCFLQSRLDVFICFGARTVCSASTIYVKRNSYFVTARIQVDDPICKPAVWNNMSASPLYKVIAPAQHIKMGSCTSSDGVVAMRRWGACCSVLPESRFIGRVQLRPT